MKNKIFIIIVLITLIIIFYCNINFRGWKKIDISNSKFYDDCNISIDLDGNKTVEQIEIKSSGKYIIINNKEYVINKKYTDKKTDSNSIFSQIDGYNKNQYHIIDINNDNIKEIIHRTYSTRISPITSYYTIYNYYNDEIYQIGEMAFMGNMPNEIYVKNNKLKFQYWPYESPENYKEEIILDLQLPTKNK